VKAGQLLAKIDNAILRDQIAALKQQMELANTVYEKQKAFGIKKSVQRFSFYRQRTTKNHWKRT
jgi:membrane fusion protein (multidrug efflux system)